MKKKSRLMKCSDCKGTGHAEGKSETCGRCKGHGTIYSVRYAERGKWEVKDVKTY